MAIYKENDKYYFRCYYTNLNGERKQYKSKRFSRKKDAENEERLFLMTISNNINKDITFKDVFVSYINFKKDKIKISSLNSIEKKYRYIESLKNIKINDFNISQFNQWKEKLNKTNLSTSTKNNVYGLLRALIKYSSQYYDTNDKIIFKMTNFTNPNELKKEMLFFDYDEFSKFILQEKDVMWKSFFETLYFCGLRLGEIKALKWKDIDFNKNTISINKSIISKIKGEKYIISTPKTKGSIRTIQFPKRVGNSLKTLYNSMIQFTDFNDDWFVFGGTVPLSDTTIQKRKNENCKEANVKQIRIHDFRHSCASLLINQNANITLISKYLGHTDIATTLNTYSHFFSNEYDYLMEKLDNL